MAPELWTQCTLTDEYLFSTFLSFVFLLTLRETCHWHDITIVLCPQGILAHETGLGIIASLMGSLQVLEYSSTHTCVGVQ